MQATRGVMLLQCPEHGRNYVGIADMACWLADRQADVAVLILCGGCGEAIPVAEAHVLPGDPPEARCGRCIGEEARR